MKPGKALWCQFSVKLGQELSTKGNFYFKYRATEIGVNYTGSFKF